MLKGTPAFRFLVIAGGVKCRWNFIFRNYLPLDNLKGGNLN